MSSETNTCSCGRVWLITKHKSPMRDKDSLSCDCGAELKSWNGGVFYKAHLIQDVKNKDKT